MIKYPANCCNNRRSNGILKLTQLMALLFLLLILLLVSRGPVKAETSGSVDFTFDTADRASRAILKDIDAFAPSPGIISFFAHHFGFGFDSFVPAAPRDLALRTSDALESLGDQNYHEILKQLESRQTGEIKTDNTPRYTSLNREKADYLLRGLYRTRNLDTRIALLRELETILDKVIEEENIEAQDLLRRGIIAFSDTFTLAVESRENSTALGLYCRTLDLEERLFHLLSIQETGYGMHMATAIADYLPVLVRVDFTMTLKEAARAAELFQSPTYEAVILLSIVEKNILKGKEELSPEMQTRCLDEVDAFLAQFKPSSESEQRLKNRTRKYRHLVGIFYKYRNDRFSMYRELIETCMITPNNVFAPVFPFDYEVGDAELTGIDKLIDGMMTVDREKTLKYVENRVLPRLEKFSYIYRDESKKISIKHPGFINNPEMNRIVYLVYFSGLLKEYKPETSKKYAEQAVEQAFKKIKQDDEFYNIRILALANLTRHDPKNALDTARKHGINEKSLRDELLKTDPEVLLKLDLSTLEPEEIVAAAAAISQRNLPGGIDFFDSYMRDNPEKSDAVINNEQIRGAYGALLAVKLAGINGNIAVTRALKIENRDLRLLTLYFILHEYVTRSKSSQTPQTP